MADVTKRLSFSTDFFLASSILIFIHPSSFSNEPELKAEYFNLLLFVITGQILDQELTLDVFDTYLRLN
jgi:hypothetical protein